MGLRRAAVALPAAKGLLFGVVGGLALALSFALKGPEFSFVPFALSVYSVPRFTSPVNSPSALGAAERPFPTNSHVACERAGDLGSNRHQDSSCDQRDSDHTTKRHSLRHDLLHEHD